MLDKKEKLTIIDIVITVMSLVVFLYRFIMLAIPMFKSGLRDKNYKDVAMSFTMLV